MITRIIYEVQPVEEFVEVILSLMAWFNIIKYKYVQEIHFCDIFLAKKFVLSMIIRIFAATELVCIPSELQASHFYI